MSINTVSCTIFISLMVFASSVFSVNQHFEQIGQQDFLQSSTEFLIVDVRTPAEFERGHVPNAINIPLADIEKGLDMFKDKSQKIIMYCRSGRRAENALNILSANGFDNLYHLQGDMKAWEEADLPVEMP